MFLTFESLRPLENLEPDFWASTPDKRATRFFYFDDDFLGSKINFTILKSKDTQQDFIYVKFNLRMEYKIDLNTLGEEIT